MRRRAPSFDAPHKSQPMAVDIEELIIAPFREVVERGKEAVAHAEGASEDDEDVSKQMSKAAKAVVREGERALKRLQPLWDSQVEKYGDTFKSGMSKNGENPKLVRSDAARAKWLTTWQRISRRRGGRWRTCSTTLKILSRSTRLRSRSSLTCRPQPKRWLSM